MSFADELSNVAGRTVLHDKQVALNKKLDQVYKHSVYCEELKKFLIEQIKKALIRASKDSKYIIIDGKRKVVETIAIPEYVFEHYDDGVPATIHFRNEFVNYSGYHFGMSFYNYSNNVKNYVWSIAPECINTLESMQKELYKDGIYITYKIFFQTEAEIAKKIAFFSNGIYDSTNNMVTLEIPHLDIHYQHLTPYKWHYYYNYIYKHCENTRTYLGYGIEACSFF